MPTSSGSARATAPRIDKHPRNTRGETQLQRSELCENTPFPMSAAGRHLKKTASKDVGVRYSIPAAVAEPHKIAGEEETDEIIIAGAFLHGRIDR